MCQLFPVTFHGDTAECTVVVGQRYFWIPVKKDTFTVTLTLPAQPLAIEEGETS